jgi:hypothetical protein
MFEVYHAFKIKKLRSLSKSERLEQLVSYAEANPKSYLSQFFAAREAWFQRDLTTAHYYAMRALALDAEPYHIDMTVICAEYHAEQNEVTKALNMAKQVLVSRRLDRLTQRLERVISAPLLLIAPWHWYRLHRKDADEIVSYNEWQQWAKEYIRLYGDAE